MKQWSSSSLFAGVCFSATLLSLYQTDWKLDHQASMFGSSPNKFHCELCCSRKKKTITYLPLPPSCPVQTIVERLTLTTVTFIFGWVVSDLNTQEHTTAPFARLPTELSLVTEMDAVSVGWQQSQPVSLSGGVVDGNHVSSDFNWLGGNEVICWDRLTCLGCPFGNSCTRAVWSAAPGLVMTTFSLHTAGWCGVADMHDPAGGGMKGLRHLCWAPGVHAHGLAHGVISVLGSLSNKYASVGLKQSFYYQRKL